MSCSECGIPHMAGLPIKMINGYFYCGSCAEEILKINKEENKYFIPYGIKKNTQLYFTYLDAIKKAEQSFLDLVESGASIEDASNILPQKLKK